MESAFPIRPISPRHSRNIMGSHQQNSEIIIDGEYELRLEEELQKNVRWIEGNSSDIGDMRLREKSGIL